MTTAPSKSVSCSGEVTLSQLLELPNVEKDTAEIVQKLLSGSLPVNAFKSVRTRKVRQPSEEHLRLVAVNEVVGGQGVEYIPRSTDTRRRKTGLEYVDFGDLYSPTCIFDHGRDEFIVGQVGKLLEETPQQFRTDISDHAPLIERVESTGMSLAKTLVSAVLFTATLVGAAALIGGVPSLLLGGRSKVSPSEARKMEMRQRVEELKKQTWERHRLGLTPSHEEELQKLAGWLASERARKHKVHPNMQGPTRREKTILELMAWHQERVDRRSK